MRAREQHALADAHTEVDRFAEVDLLLDAARPRVDAGERRFGELDVFGPGRQHDAIADADVLARGRRHAADFAFHAYARAVGLEAAHFATQEIRRSDEIGDERIRRPRIDRARRPDLHE